MNKIRRNAFIERCVYLILTMVALIIFAIEAVSGAPAYWLTEALLGALFAYIMYLGATRRYRRL